MLLNEAVRKLISLKILKIKKSQMCEKLDLSSCICSCRRVGRGSIFFSQICLIQSTKEHTQLSHTIQSVVLSTLNGHNPNPAHSVAFILRFFHQFDSFIFYLLCKSYKGTRKILQKHKKEKKKEKQTKQTKKHLTWCIAGQLPHSD